MEKNITDARGGQEKGLEFQLDINDADDILDLIDDDLRWSSLKSSEKDSGFDRQEILESSRSENSTRR